MSNGIFVDFLSHSTEFGHFFLFLDLLVFCLYIMVSMFIFIWVFSLSVYDSCTSSFFFSYFRFVWLFPKEIKKS